MIIILRIYSLKKFPIHVPLVIKKAGCQCRIHKRHRFQPWVGKISWRRTWQPTPVFFFGEFHRQRSPVDYSLQGRIGLDMTKVTKHALLAIVIMFVNHVPCTQL